MIIQRVLAYEPEEVAATLCNRHILTKPQQIVMGDQAWMQAYMLQKNKAVQHFLLSGHKRRRHQPLWHDLKNWNAQQMTVYVVIV